MFGVRFSLRLLTCSVQIAAETLSVLNVDDDAIKKIDQNRRFTGSTDKMKTSKTLVYKPSDANEYTLLTRRMEKTDAPVSRLDKFTGKQMESVEKLQAALCNLHDALDPDTVKLFKEYAEVSKNVTSNAAHFLMPQMASDWKELIKASLHKPVPYELVDGSAVCVICHNEFETLRKDTPLFVVNSCCCSHDFCSKIEMGARCKCSAVMCLECAAFMCQTHL